MAHGQKVFELNNGVTYYGTMGRITYQAKTTVSKKTSDIVETSIKRTSRKGAQK